MIVIVGVTVIVRVRVIVGVIVIVIVRVRVIVGVIVIVGVTVIVRVRVTHGELPRRSMRTTATAAPNPLSMLTTVTPDAQLVSIPNSAVRPERAVP